MRFTQQRGWNQIAFGSCRRIVLCSCTHPHCLQMQDFFASSRDFAAHLVVLTNTSCSSHSFLRVELQFSLRRVICEDQNASVCCIHKLVFQFNHTPNVAWSHSQMKLLSLFHCAALKALCIDDICVDNLLIEHALILWHILPYGMAAWFIINVNCAWYGEYVKETGSHSELDWYLSFHGHCF